MVNRSFSPFPMLTTERLTLRQLTNDDHQDIFTLRSDPDINKHIDREPSKTIEDAMDFINKVNNNIRKNNSLYWVITLTKTRVFVGTICLFDFSNEEDICEIGYELMKQYQGQGMMTEATKAVIDFAFRTLNFQKIVALTRKANHNSTNLLTKLNFLQSKGADAEDPDCSVFTLTRVVS